jgi:hypothetical protein
MEEGREVDGLRQAVVTRDLVADGRLLDRQVRDLFGDRLLRDAEDLDALGDKLADREVAVAIVGGRGQGEGEARPDPLRLSRDADRRAARSASALGRAPRSAGRDRRG